MFIVVSQLEQTKTKADIKAFNTNHNKKVVSQLVQNQYKNRTENGNLRERGNENKPYTKATSIFKRNAGIKDN